MLTSFGTIDERRTVLEQAAAGTLLVNNNQPLSSVRVYPDASLRLLRAIFELADAVVVGSETERRRLQDISGTDPDAILRPMRDAAVPAPPEGERTLERDAIVIWAAHLTPDSAMTFAIALADFRIPIILVAGKPPAENSLVQWIPLERAAEALSRARLILDTTPYCGDAILPLSEWGAPLVADIESGAQELLDNVRVFDRRRMPSVFEAVSSALGKEPPKRRESSLFTSSEVTRARPTTDQPLVSIIIPTYDRPTLLRIALDSVFAQSYRNIETLVVIDGGPPLDAVAADYPTVTFLQMPENDGVRSMNTAFANVSGKYLTILNDDDIFFPNHVASLVETLETSGAAVAHADVLTAFLRGSDGNWQVYGFESNMSQAAPATNFLLYNPVGLTSCMFRRDCIIDGMLIDPTLAYYFDYGLWLRLVSKFDFIHVERITSCYTIRNQGAEQQSIMWADLGLDAYRDIYRRYPAADRPLIQQRRAEMLESFARNGTRPSTQPAAEIVPVPWPLTL